ncbi:MAG: hypothetical protein AB1422_14955 [bacterium]
MKIYVYIIIGMMILFSQEVKAELNAELDAWGNEIEGECDGENPGPIFMYNTIGAKLDPFITVNVQGTGLYWEITSPGKYKAPGTKIDVEGNARCDIYLEGAGNLVYKTNPAKPILEARYAIGGDNQNTPPEDEFKDIAYLSTYPLVENLDTSGGQTYYLWGEVTSGIEDPATVDDNNPPQFPPNEGEYQDSLGFWMTFVAHL